MIVYKLLRMKKDGKLYPLFINKTEATPMGIWMAAQCYPTKGFAVRCGWHCTLKPEAPHLKTELKSGEKRVWVKCEADQIKLYNRPESQGGTWALCQNLKLLEVLN